jgi:hypothetical protein
MHKYRVHGAVTVSVFKTIYADTPEEAIAAAAELAMPSFCHQCERTGHGDPETWQFNGELDGDAVGLSATVLS